MADNVQLSAGSGGDIAAADDIGGIKFPRNKLVHGADGTNDGDVAFTNPLPTHPYAVATGGESNHHLIAAATTNAANVKASAGQVYRVHIYNNADYPVYLKFHNTAGAPTAGVSVVHAIGCQAGLSRDVDFPRGLPFATGIGITLVKGITDADATATAVNDASVEIGYK